MRGLASGTFRHRYGRQTLHLHATQLNLGNIERSDASARRLSGLVRACDLSTFDQIGHGARLKGLDPAGIAEIVQVARFGANALNIVFRVDGRVGERLLYRGEETSFEFVEAGRSYAFDADGGLLRLASEAYRIRLAHLFDPYLAVTASQIEALPHQITAVYGEMLPRQPLRFLLADDPGAGKTIMAGLLIKELLIRGDLERCLIVAPGSLVEQWQDEMAEKFGLGFDPVTRDQIEASITGNPFVERNRLILRLDMAARSDELKAKLGAAPEWDLVICDEAHRMAASYFGGEVKETRRYKLGKLLGTRTRNLLLMSATPHNGKEADFQLFMGLLDADRFEGRFREGVHKADVSDMLRRLIKEELYRMDGTPLFPERRAYTAGYALSPEEVALYQAVTTYVRDEMNRADRTGDGNRRTSVGFALQILQRRLASSPAAIHRSLERRRKRLEERLREERLAARWRFAADAFAGIAKLRSGRARGGSRRRAGGGRRADPRFSNGGANVGRTGSRNRHLERSGGARAAPEAVRPRRKMA
jgi:SNF2 domain-containing protein